MTLLLRTLFTVKVTEVVDVTAVGITAACSVVWWLLLSAQGEEVPAAGPHLVPARKSAFCGNSILSNATLLKVSGNRVHFIR